MKYTIMVMWLLFTLPSEFFAQTNKGTLAVGADFPRFFTGLTRSGMKLNVGVFIAENFLFGINSGIRHRTLKDLSGKDFDGPALDLGFFVRYYVPDDKGKIRSFIHGEGGLDRTWAGDLRERYEYVGLGGGFTFFINQDLALEAHTVFRLNNQGDELNFSWPQWGLGIKYFFISKAE